MLKKIDHIGIATNSIAEALAFWTKGLGLDVTHAEEIADQKVRTAFLPLGEVNIELLEGTSPDSPISKFVEKNRPGVHHLCFEVKNIHAALAALQEQGLQLIDQAPRMGAHGKLVAFVHPKSTGGILLELSQSTDHESFSKV